MRDLRYRELSLLVRDKRVAESLREERRCEIRDILLF